MKTFKMFHLLSIVILCTLLVPAGVILASGVTAPPTAQAALARIAAPVAIDNANTATAVELMSTSSLTPSFKMASTSVAELSETVVYTVGVRSSDGPIDVTAFMTDTLPQGLQYVPGSLSATSGITDDSNAPSLYWTGVLSPDAEIDITFSVVVTNVVNGTTIILPPRIINAATITAGDDTVTPSATISIGGGRIYLPLVFNNNS